MDAEPEIRLNLRPVEPADWEFLYQVYASTRQEELALTGWPPAQVDAFLRSQFAAQKQHYDLHYAGAEFAVIEVGGLPAGRLYVYRCPSEIRIVDIALLPEYRGRGLGSHLLDRVCAEAAALGVPVTIHVERFNPALRLYLRRGFKPVDETGVYWFLAWRPEDNP